jgi:hypothetical protein
LLSDFDTTSPFGGPGNKREKLYKLRKAIQDSAGRWAKTPPHTPTETLILHITCAHAVRVEAGNSEEPHPKKIRTKQKVYLVDALDGNSAPVSAEPSEGIVN